MTRNFTYFFCFMFLSIAGFSKPVRYDPFFLTIKSHGNGNYFINNTKDDTRVVTFSSDHIVYINNVIHLAKTDHRYVNVDIDIMKENGATYIHKNVKYRTSYVFVSTEKITHDFSVYETTRITCTRASSHGCDGRFSFDSSKYDLNALYSMRLDNLLNNNSVERIKVDLTVLTDAKRYESYYSARNVFKKIRRKPKGVSTKPQE